MDDDIFASECFEILNRHVQLDEPSWATFFAFLSFMYSAFVGMNSYPVFNGHILASMNGLEALKHVFTSLLIETSKDFSLRAVPRGIIYSHSSMSSQASRFILLFRRFSVSFNRERFRR